jgi:hypothetical protein
LSHFFKTPCEGKAEYAKQMEELPLDRLAAYE